MPASKSRFPQGDPATQVTPHRWPQETNPDPDTPRLLRVDAHLNNTQARTSLCPCSISHLAGRAVKGTAGERRCTTLQGRDLLGRRCPYATDATYSDVAGKAFVGRFTYQTKPTPLFQRNWSSAVVALVLSRPGALVSWPPTPCTLLVAIGNYN